MSDKLATKQSSGDWLKALSVLAICAGGLPEGYSGSAAVAGFVFVVLANFSRSIFYCLYTLATGFLIWFAVASGDALLAGYAVLYVALGVVLVAEGERRRSGRGHFLAALWWSGQALLLGLDIRHAYSSGGASGFFTDLFLVISLIMVARETIRGVKHHFRQRADSVVAEHLTNVAQPAQAPRRDAA